MTLVKNYLHIIFSTKNRENLIDSYVEKQLFGYLGDSCNQLGCEVLIVGGYLNHIHILCNLSKHISLKELVQKIKGQSSKWIKSKGSNYEKFYWQAGYGAFSVNPQQLKL